MTCLEASSSFTLLIIILSTVISTIVVPLYRLITFKNKLVYIKNKYFENKISATIIIVLFPVLIYLTINELWNLAIELNENFDYLLLVRNLRIIIYVYIILNVLVRLPKQCIYKERIKTDRFFIRWNEIESINEDGNDIKIYYIYKTADFFC